MSSIEYRNRMPLIPVSWGELIDKLTILEIKKSKIKNYQSIINIKNEFNLLSEVVEKNIKIIDIKIYKDNLYKVNEKLWDVEDKIREFENRKIFNIEFVELARSVYILNDQRANIKREINIKLQSELIEEKGYLKN